MSVKKIFDFRQVKERRSALFSDRCEFIDEVTKQQRIIIIIGQQIERVFLHRLLLQADL